MGKKYLQIAEIIRTRIEHGDYPDGCLSGLRVLSSELGVNYLTVRQALHVLCEKGVLLARNNKRFEIIEQKRPSPAGGDFAILLPMGTLNLGFVSLISNVISEMGGRIRRLAYSYYEDDAIPLAFGGDFDLVFFFIDPQKAPSLILDKLAANKDKAVSIVYDYRDRGIRLLAEADVGASVKALLEQLAIRGHKRLDILGAAHDNEVIARRIQFAEKCSASYGLAHTSLRKTVPEFFHEFEMASELARQLYGGGMRPDSIFVPTVPAAMAVIRTLKDIGHTVGVDYSLVSCEDLQLAKNCIPSIAVSYTPTLDPCVRDLLECHKNGNHDKLFFSPKSPELFLGESLKPLK